MPGNVFIYKKGCAKFCQGFQSWFWVKHLDKLVKSMVKIFKAATFTRAQPELFLTCCLPIYLPSTLTLLKKELTICPEKNYSHCDNLSPLEVSWLASSPERGAGCLSAHLNSCECLIAFLFKNNSHLVCHYFLSLVFQTGSTHVHVPASCPCYCYAVLGEACNLNASSIRQACPTYAFWDTNEFSLMQNHKLTTSYDILKI